MWTFLARKLLCRLCSRFSILYKKLWQIYHELLLANHLLSFPSQVTGLNPGLLQRTSMKIFVFQGEMVVYLCLLKKVVLFHISREGTFCCKIHGRVILVLISIFANIKGKMVVSLGSCICYNFFRQLTNYNYS